MAHAITAVHGQSMLAFGLLGQVADRIPTGGKIRPGIMVLTRKAAEHAQAQAIYAQGVAQGRSFAQIARMLAEALPHLKSPLTPRNVPWFTVRAQDFAHPEIARQILEAYGEDRGEGRRLYRFPVVFPADHWQSVMPHELACWAPQGKRYWSQYAPDGVARHCMCHAPVAVDDTGRRAIRIFGGRKAVLREDNGGICDPEVCPEYQARQCNLSGRFLFFIPGVRTISALELPTTSFYAMSRAVQRLQAVAQLRGGRVSGFLGRERATFFLTKVLKDVAHRDTQGRVVKARQWIIELEAPVDVAELLREREDDEAVLQQAQLATQLLEGNAQDVGATPHGERPPADAGCTAGAPAARPTLEQVLARAQDMGLDAERFTAYARRRWGAGWRVTHHGRGRAWDELARHANDPQGYCDKVAAELDTWS